MGPLLVSEGSQFSSSWAFYMALGHVVPVVPVQPVHHHAVSHLGHVVPVVPVQPVHHHPVSHHHHVHCPRPVPAWTPCLSLATSSSRL